MPQRILIIGCPGSGKSTLARRLSPQTGLPVVHLDALYWLPGWVERSREDFDALLQDELEKPRWIIDGNYTRTLAMRLEKCDAVIWLDYGRLNCLTGVLKRILTHIGRVRPDMGAGCPSDSMRNFCAMCGLLCKITMQRSPSASPMRRGSPCCAHPPGGN